MKKYLTRWLPLLLAAILVLSGCMAEPVPVIRAPSTAPEASTETTVYIPLIEDDDAPDETETPRRMDLSEDGVYTSKEEVAAFIYLYHRLPDNFISKKAAKAQGWDGSAKTLWKDFPGMSIGGDYFGNYEELLPKKDGRRYTECDINFNGVSRGAERIVFSNDGLIYYSGDHYESFELLYGEE